MTTRRISMIVAMARNRVIGRDGDLPWRLSDDLKRFKRLTMGHHIVMGRATYDSLGRLLPGRTTVIISRNPEYEVPGAIVVASLQDAITACGDDDEIFVIGGGQIFTLAFPICNRLYLTTIHEDVEGDTWFPEWDAEAWRVVEQSEHAVDDRNDYANTFQILER